MESISQQRMGGGGGGKQSNEATHAIVSSEHTHEVHAYQERQHVLAGLDFEGGWDLGTHTELSDLHQAPKRVLGVLMNTGNTSRGGLVSLLRSVEVGGEEGLKSARWGHGTTGGWSCSCSA